MAETSVAITAGTGTPIDAYNSGTGSALRQAVVLADPVTTANVVRINSDGGMQVSGTQAAASTASWTSATTVNTALTISVAGYNTVTVAMANTSTMTAGTLTFEVSPDNSNWFAISMARIDSYTVENFYVMNTVTPHAWSTSVDGFTNFRVRLSGTITGTGTATVIVTPQAMPIEPIVTVGQSLAGNLQATATQGNAGATAWLQNVSQINGVTPLMGNGTTGTGSQRVTIASDNTAFGINVATKTTGGATTFTLISAATTNATNVKSSAGTVYGIQASNTGASVAFLKIFNLSTAPTVGTSVAVKTLIIPAGGGITVPIAPAGLAFGTGIAISITGVATTADTTAVALSQVVANIDYA